MRTEFPLHVVRSLRAIVKTGVNRASDLLCTTDRTGRRGQRLDSGQSGRGEWIRRTDRKSGTDYLIKKYNSYSELKVCLQLRS